MAEIIMMIEGHDWRYTGDGWKWLPNAKSWDDLVRVGYAQKQCMVCGYIGAPEDDVRPCNELWSDRTGNLSVAEDGGAVYRPGYLGK